MRLVIEQVKVKMVNDAIPLLTFMTSPASKEILKILNSAIANAENNALRTRDNLKITRITADRATWIRRYRPKARGRAGAFDRPTSHLTIEVEEAENS